MSHDHRDWEKLDGKFIRTIWFKNRIEDMCPYIEATNGHTLEMSAIYMGDRTELWVIDKEAGKEVARYNASALESIHWR